MLELPYQAFSRHEPSGDSFSSDSQYGYLPRKSSHSSSLLGFEDLNQSSYHHHHHPNYNNDIHEFSTDNKATTGGKSSNSNVNFIDLDLYQDDYLD